MFFIAPSRHLLHVPFTSDIAQPSIIFVQVLLDYRRYDGLHVKQELVIENSIQLSIID
jgi:hypothetical protein